MRHFVDWDHLWHRFLRLRPSYRSSKEDTSRNRAALAWAPQMAIFSLFFSRLWVQLRPAGTDHPANAESSR